MSLITICMSDEDILKSTTRYFNNIRWLLTHRNKTIKQRMLLSPFSLEQFQLHFRVTKEDFTKTGLCFLLLHQLQQEKYLVGAYVIHLGQQLM